MADPSQGPGSARGGRARAAAGRDPRLRDLRGASAAGAAAGSRRRVERAAADRRPGARAPACTRPACRGTTPAASGCARGWPSTAPLFYDASRVAIVPQGFCYPGNRRRRRPAAAPRNAPPPGTTACWRCCPTSSWWSPPAPTPQAFHLGRRRRPHPHRDGARPGATTRPPWCRCRTPPGATMGGSRATRGSSARPSLYLRARIARLLA